MPNNRMTKREREIHYTNKYSVKPYVQIKATRANAVLARKIVLDTLTELEILMMHLNIMDAREVMHQLAAGYLVSSQMLEKTLVAYAIQIGEQCNILARYIRNKDLDYIDEHSLLYEVANIRHGLVHSYTETSNEHLLLFVLHLYAQDLKHTVENYKYILPDT